MTMALAWLAALAVFLGLDALWLGFVGGAMYRSVLGDIMMDGFRIVPAVVFYALQIIGILVFVLPLAQARGGLLAVAAYGAFYGVCTYATYDLTNYAVIRVWTAKLTITDIVWGAIVTAAASLAAALVYRLRA